MPQRKVSKDWLDSFQGSASLVTQSRPRHTHRVTYTYTIYAGGMPKTYYTKLINPRLEKMTCTFHDSKGSSAPTVSSNNCSLCIPEAEHCTKTVIWNILREHRTADMRGGLLCGDNRGAQSSHMLHQGQR